MQYDESEVLGKKVHPIIHHSYADGSPYPVEQCPMFLAYSEGKVSHFDNEVLWRKDGSSVPVEYKAHPIIKDKVISGSVVTFSDISERIQAEEQLINEVANRKQSESIAEHTKKRLMDITDNIPGVVFQFQSYQDDLIVKHISEGIALLQGVTIPDVLANFNHFIYSIYLEDQSEVLLKSEGTNFTVYLLACMITNSLPKEEILTACKVQAEDINFLINASVVPYVYYGLVSSEGISTKLESEKNKKRQLAIDSAVKYLNLLSMSGLPNESDNIEIERLFKLRKSNAFYSESRIYGGGPDNDYVCDLEFSAIVATKEGRAYAVPSS